MLTLIRGGRVVDPGNWDDVKDIYITGDRIAHIGSPEDTRDEKAASLGKPDKIIDAAGKIVSPGLIDLHVHFREPGQEYKETIETGAMAAAAGGFTTVCCMPNTDPVCDNSQIVKFIISQAEKAGKARVLPVGAISLGLSGKQLSEFGEMKQAGIIAVTDDGMPVTDSLLMRRALEYAKGFGLFVMSHSEDLCLAASGSMNEGATATRLGVAGIPNAAESIMVMRDIALCELTRARLHIAHVSTRESVEAIRQAKKRGVPVTAETAPHYFSLTDEAVGEYSTYAKMNPPLRMEKDVLAIQEGLADGTLDVIATDHAPHADIEKNVEFDKAANGIVGLETSLPLGLSLVRQNILSLPGLIEKMSKQPARILNMNNDIMTGAVADITIIDTKKLFEVNALNFKSKGRNTPFDGWPLKGKAVATIYRGKVVHDETIPES